MAGSEIDAELVEGVRRFVRDRITPHAPGWNRDGIVPDSVFAEIGQLGLFGLLLPERYGGSGCNLSTFIAVIEELAAGDGGLSTLVHVHGLGSSMLLARLGSEAQKEAWLGKMVTGEVLGAVCLTEPSAGSDLSAITGRAVRVPGGWQLNATKQFITNGARAGLVIVLAVNDAEAGSRGKSFFLVPKGTQGFAPGRIERKMGQHTSDTAQMQFDNCFVPDDMVLGDVGAALPLAMGLLSDGRISVAAQAVGMARAAYELALDYARERTAFGKPIFDHQAVGFRLADMNAAIDVARVYTRHAARLFDDGMECTREASIAKLIATEMAEKVCSDAIQVHGGNGYLSDYRVEQIFRDVRVCQIYEGTSDIQRLIIARCIRG